MAKKKKDYSECFKWANGELKTGRDICSIVFSWGGTYEEEIIAYYEAAKEAGEERIVKEMKKEFKTIKEYDNKTGANKQTDKRGAYTGLPQVGQLKLSLGI